MKEIQHPRASGSPMSSSLSPESIRDQAKARGEPGWLLDARVAAFERYEKMAPPQWRRTDLAGLDVAARAAALHRGSNAYAKDAYVKREGVVHMGLVQAAREHEALVRPLLEVSPRADKWETLVNALWTGGTFLYVEKDRQLDAPVSMELRYAKAGGLTRDVIAAGPRAKANVVTRADGAASDALVGSLVEIDVQEGANLSLATLQDLARGATLLSDRHARVRRDAHLSWIDGQFGAGTSVTINETLLTQPGSNVKFLGAFFGSGGQHMDITTSALHEAPHTSAQLDMKGALNEDGYSANYSIVNIGPLAKSSSGHQHQETLLLSDKARADAIPKLDVENNDVSASHGATVGQVDPEQMFYLRSRGMSEQAAKRMIVEGFFEPLLGDIPVEDVREEIRQTVISRLKG